MRKKLLVLTVAATAFAMSALTGSAAASVTIGGLPQAGAGAGGCTLCTFVQVGADPSGPSYSVPSDGVITSFSIQVGTIVKDDSWVNFHVLHYVFGNAYAIDVETGKVSIPATAAATTLLHPTRLTVRANQLLGLTLNSGTSNGDTTPFGYTSSSSDLIGAFPLQPNVGEAANLNGSPLQQRQLNIRAVLEPDVDKDGYGDETQDCYANDPASHVWPCPDTVAPVISGLRSKNAKFAVNKKGALVVAKTSKGTNFTFSASEAATVSFSIARASKSAKTKKTTYKTVENFKRAAIAGTNSVAYSGRFRNSKKRKTELKPGKYKLTATAVDASGNVGAPQTVRFTVVANPKH